MATMRIAASKLRWLHARVLSMKAGKKMRRKTDEELLEHATDNLLMALKKEMVTKEGRVDYDKLRNQGYSERASYLPTSSATGAA